MNLRQLFKNVLVEGIITAQCPVGGSDSVSYAM